MVFVGDVPIQTSHQFVVALISRETGPATCIVTILAGHVLRNSLQVFVGRTRNVVIRIRYTILRTSPTVNHCRNLNHFTVNEEEQLVLDDRTTQSETIGCGLTLLTGTVNLLTLHGITLHILVLVIDVGATLEGVRT